LPSVNDTTQLRGRLADESLTNSPNSEQCKTIIGDFYDLPNISSLKFLSFTIQQQAMQACLQKIEVIIKFSLTIEASLKSIQCITYEKLCFVMLTA